MNKLFVGYKPLFQSSNYFLTKIKRKYKNKKAGFSGTLDPFACGVLVIAFGQYPKLFPYLKKIPKTYQACLWLGTQSASLDLENISAIKHPEQIQKLDLSKIKTILKGLEREITYTPPIFSAKKIKGKRAYDLARSGETPVLKEEVMKVFKTKFLAYKHPFLSFEVSVSQGSYVRSFAQILCEGLKTTGSLSYLKRMNEGKFFFENEKFLNPLDFLDLKENFYKGQKEYFMDGKLLDLKDFEYQENGLYFVKFDDFFSIIEINEEKIIYKLNKVLLE